VTPRIFFCYPDNKQKIRGVTSTRLAKSQPFVNDLFFDENGLVKDLDEKLDAMLSHDDVTHDCIDDIVSDLQNIFIHTAKSTFGYTLNEPRSTDKNPWFDNTSLQLS
jgi:hypothetical protein